MKQIIMTDAECKMMKSFLEDESDTIAANGEDIMSIPNTPENMELVEKAIRFFSPDEEEQEEHLKYIRKNSLKSWIYATDDVILKYIIKLVNDAENIEENKI